jgi:hypothetical protein
MATFSGTSDVARRRALHVAAVNAIAAHAEAIARGDTSKRAGAESAHRAYLAETSGFRRFVLPE